MGKPVNIYSAKTQLSALVDRAAAGEEIVIAKAGKPRARLGPLPTGPKTTRHPGAWKGRLWMASDFDAPLPDEILKRFSGGGE